MSEKRATLGLTGNYLGTQLIGDQLVPTYPNLVYDAAGVPTINAQAFYVIEEFPPGINASLDYQLDRHNKLVGGWWFDYYDDHQQQNYQQLRADGAPSNMWGGSGLKYPNGQELYGLDYHLFTRTNGMYIGDAMSYLSDRLKINLGFKEVIITRYGTNNLPGPQYHFGTNIAQPLPRVTASYQISPTDQVYLAATTNLHMPSAPSYSYGGGTAFQGNPALKNEYAITEEIGYRHYGLVTTTLSAFNINLTNRNISSSIYQGGYNFGTTINGGGQTLRGIDAEIGTRPWHHFSPYFSGEYLNSSIDNNVLAGATNGVNDYLPTKGKNAVQAPKFTVTGALTYDDGSNFSTFTYRWTAKQYADLMNQETLPSHGQIDWSLGHRFKSVWRLQHPQVQLNLVNLANWHYLSGVSTVSTNARNTTGVYGNPIAGSSPVYYIGAGFAAMGTFTAGF